ncbi:SMI1/KNR4 family protein [Erwinia sp. D4-22]
MNKDEVLYEISLIEKKYNISFPSYYKKFLSEEVKDKDVHEIQNSQGDAIYFYSFTDLIERNEIYTIQDVEPDYMLIGQDGDLGYFVNVKNGSDQIYSSDLGALGSLDMDVEAKDIYKLIN